MGNTKRRKPLAAITAIWEKNSRSQYPETIRVPMNNGHVVTYRLDIEQPHPCFLNAMELLRSMPVGMGYQYNEKR